MEIYIYFGSPAFIPSCSINFPISLQFRALPDKLNEMHHTFQYHLQVYVTIATTTYMLYSVSCHSQMFCNCEEMEVFLLISEILDSRPTLRIVFTITFLRFQDLFFDYMQYPYILKARYLDLIILY